MHKIALSTATADDAEAIAALHVAVWRLTYHDLAPAEAVATLDFDRRIGQWQRRLAVDHGENPVLVARSEGIIVGFVAGTLSAAAVFEGRAEISHLYVGRETQGQGLGRLLLETMRSRLFGKGATGVGLGVVDGNDAAVGFYRALGGKIIGRYTDPGPIWPSDNLIMVWDRDDDAAI